MTEIVHASGGVITRSGQDGEPEVLLVHRPRYDDWSLPKGKLVAGESDERCALREVEEETGLVCELGVELASSEYIDTRGRPKVVRFWAMTPLSGAFLPHAEVDEARWLSLEEARALLSYDRDRLVLASLGTSD